MESDNPPCLSDGTDVLYLSDGTALQSLSFPNLFDDSVVPLFGCTARPCWADNETLPHLIDNAAGHSLLVSCSAGGMVLLLLDYMALSY